MNAMERRKNINCFLQWLSLIIVLFSFGGAGWVLMDPQITIITPWIDIQIGNTPFSSDLKGAVISAILIGGFAGVTGYWLGASNSNIAKGSASPTIQINEAEKGTQNVNS